MPQKKLDLEPIDEVKVGLDLEPVEEVATPVVEAPKSKQSPGKFVTQGFQTQWVPAAPQGQKNIENRPDSNMFDISPEGRDAWRNSITNAVGVSTLPESLKGIVGTGAGFLGAELPFGIIDAMRSPESLLFPSAVKGLGAATAKVPRKVTPRIPKTAAEVVPETINTPIKPRVRVTAEGKPVEAPIIDPKTQSSIDPVSGVETPLTPDATVRPQFNQPLPPVRPPTLMEKTQGKIDKAFGTAKRLASDEGGTLDLNAFLPKRVARTGTQIMDSLQPNTGNPELDGMITQFRNMENTSKARWHKGYTDEEFQIFGKLVNDIRQHPAFPKELGVEWDAAAKVAQEATPSINVGDKVQMKDQAAIQNAAITNRNRFQVVKRLFSDEAGTFDPYKLSANLKKALGNGIQDSTVIQVRNAILQTVARGGQVNVEQLLQKFGGKVTPEHLDTIVDDMIDSSQSFKDIEVLPEGTKISTFLADKKRGNLAETLMLPRAIQSSWDMSFPFRQGLGLIHKKAWWQSWDDMVKAMGSETAFRTHQEALMADPLFKNIVNKDGVLVAESYANRAGLKLSDLVSAREEQIASTWAESGGSIPGFSPIYRATMGRGVRASNRAYTAFSNELKSGTFRELVTKAEALGLDPINNIDVGEAIANFVNSASGRGSIGKLEKHAELLNAAFFSPRLQASRIQMIKDGLNYKNYARAMGGDPRAKMMSREALKSVWTMVGTWTAIATAAKMAGAEVSTDPTSSDFGKIKIGNTRLDPAGGLQQYLVLAARMGAGGQTSSTSGNFTEFGSKYGARSRWDASSDFLMNKTSPWFAFGKAVLDANKDQPFAVADQTVRMFMPMLMQDMIDVAAEDPNLIPFAIPVGIASGIGIGTQSYGEKTKGERRAPGMFGEGDINFKGGSFGF